MLQADAGDDRRLRGGDHVGGVQPPPQAYLQHHDVTPCRLEAAKAHAGQQLKLGGGVLHGVCRGLDSRRRGAEGLIGDLLPVDPEALIVPHQMGRGIKAHPQPRLPQAGVQQRGGGALAVGPRHMDEFQTLLGASQQGKQLLHPRQPQVAAQHVHMGEIVQHLLIGHGLPPSQLRLPACFMDLFSFSSWWCSSMGTTSTQTNIQVNPPLYRQKPPWRFGTQVTKI